MIPGDNVSINVILHMRVVRVEAHRSSASTGSDSPCVGAIPPWLPASMIVDCPIEARWFSARRRCGPARGPAPTRCAIMANGRGLLKECSERPGHIVAHDRHIGARIEQEGHCDQLA